MNERLTTNVDEFLAGLGRGAFIGTPGVVFALSIGLAYDTSNAVAAAIFLATTALVWHAHRGDDT